MEKLISFFINLTHPKVKMNIYIYIQGSIHFSSYILCFGITCLVTRSTLLPLVTLVCPLVVIVCPLAVLVCPLIVSVCPLVVLVLLSVGLFITDLI